MGKRFTVRLSEKNAEWVAEESANKERSKAWVIDEAVRAARGAESTYTHRSGADRADSATTADNVLDRLSELEERVDDLEGRPDFDIAQSGFSAPSDDDYATRQPATEPVTPTQPLGESDDADPIGDALGGWSYGRTDEEQAANETVARASLEWLRETTDAVQQSDLPLDDIAEVDPEDRKKDTLWRTVIRGAWQHAAGLGYVERPNSRAYRWDGPAVDGVQTDSGVYDPTEEFDQ